MANLFRAYRVRDTIAPTYFIESTAPDDVDVLPPLAPVPSNLCLIKPEVAITEIAAHLSQAPDPNLVVMVHGFNNPQSVVLKLYSRIAGAIHADSAIIKDRGLVCVGYRWPSEKMGTPWPSCAAALPSLPSWIFWLGVIFIVVRRGRGCGGRVGDRPRARHRRRAVRRPHRLRRAAPRHRLFSRLLSGEQLRRPRPDRNRPPDRPRDPDP